MPKNETFIRELKPWERFEPNYGVTDTSELDDRIFIRDYNTELNPNSYRDPEVVEIVYEIFNGVKNE